MNEENTGKCLRQAELDTPNTHIHDSSLPWLGSTGLIGAEVGRNVISVVLNMFYEFRFIPNLIKLIGKLRFLVVLNFKSSSPMHSFGSIKFMVSEISLCGLMDLDR
jgi:phosphotransferase system  glucose/maltose/N-acetylglucosamine-specific IIC component